MLNIRNKKFEVKFIGVGEKHSHEFINGKKRQIQLPKNGFNKISK